MTLEPSRRSFGIVRSEKESLSGAIEHVPLHDRSGTTARCNFTTSSSLPVSAWLLPVGMTFDNLCGASVSFRCSSVLLTRCQDNRTSCIAIPRHASRVDWVSEWNKVAHPSSGLLKGLTCYKWPPCCSHLYNDVFTSEMLNSITHLSSYTSSRYISYNGIQPNLIVLCKRLQTLRQPLRHDRPKLDHNLRWQR